MTFDLSELNYLAVLVGGLLYMAFGAFYYSPVLFGNKWVRANGLQGDHMKNPLIYVGAVAVAFLSSFLIASLIQATGADSLFSGLAVGLSAGLLLALGSFKNMIFGAMTKKVFAIAVGDHLIALSLLSMLHTIWR